jgi:radical SAM protein with 4Fe4S-binding SPASM domain
MLNHCWRLWHSTVITWDGLVVPCCFDKDAKHQLGDLKSTSFKELWQSDAYNNFRASVLRSRSEIDICKNCTEGTKVWA